MGDCAYCGKRRINFNQDKDYIMRIGNLFALADAMRMDPRDLVEKVDE